MPPFHLPTCPHLLTLTLAEGQDFGSCNDRRFISDARLRAEVVSVSDAACLSSCCEMPQLSSKLPLVSENAIGLQQTDSLFRPPDILSYYIFEASALVDPCLKYQVTKGNRLISYCSSENLLCLCPTTVKSIPNSPGCHSQI